MTEFGPFAAVPYAALAGEFWNDKEPSSFLVPGPRAHGFAVALVEYTLAPEADIAQIVATWTGIPVSRMIAGATDSSKCVSPETSCKRWRAVRMPKPRTTTAMPASTSAAPKSCTRVMGSPRKKKPRKMVATGPTEPTIEACVAPMRRIPSEVSTIGMTVEAAAMRTLSA